MATLLVSDTSVLVDLDRGGILNALFQLPFDIGVPDVLYDLELKDWEGPNLVAAGLRVLVLDGDGVALAKTENHILLAGDASLRKLAEIEEVEVHGVLWVIDTLDGHKVLSGVELLQALTLIAEHPRCRLPKSEIQQRLKRYPARPWLLCVFRTIVNTHSVST